MTETLLALVAALIAVIAGVVLVAIQQTRRIAEVKKAKARAEALAKAAELARQQAEKEAALKKARTSAKKKPQPLLGVVSPDNTPENKKKGKK
jgi:type II secretory pathway pseudopilin PulG